MPGPIAACAKSTGDTFADLKFATAALSFLASSVVNSLRVITLLFFKAVICWFLFSISFSKYTICRVSLKNGRTLKLTSQKAQEVQFKDSENNSDSLRFKLQTALHLMQRLTAAIWSNNEKHYQRIIIFPN